MQKALKLIDSKKQFLEEIKEIIGENPKLFKAFHKEKYE